MSLYKGKKSEQQPTQKLPVSAEAVVTKPASNESQGKDSATSTKRKENEKMISDDAKKQAKKQKRVEDTPEQNNRSLKKTLTLETIKSVVSELTESNDEVVLKDVIEKIASKYHLDFKDVKKRLLKKIHVSIGQNGAVVLH